MTTAVLNEPAANGHTQAATPTVAEYQSLVQKLGKNVVLAKVKISRWHGLYLPRDVSTISVTLDGEDMTTGEDTTTPSIRVLPRAWERRFSNIDSRLRDVINRPGRTIKIKTYEPYTAADGSTQYLEAEEDDDHIITREVADKIGAEIAQLVKDQWQPAVDELVAAYPAMIEELKTTKPGKFVLVERYLPADGSDLRKHFRVRFRKRPLGLSMDDLTLEALRSGAGEYLTAIRESIFRQAVEQLKTETGYLAQKLQEKSQIKTSTLESAREAISFFRSFADVMKADDVMPLLRQAEQALENTSVQEVNASTKKDASAIAGQLAGLMSQIAKSVDANELLDRANSRQRKIAL